VVFGLTKYMLAGTYPLMHKHRIFPQQVLLVLLQMDFVIRSQHVHLSLFALHVLSAIPAVETLKLANLPMDASASFPTVAT